MADVVLAFGPKSWFAASPIVHFRRNLPPHLEEKFRETGYKRIAYVHHLVLGVNDSYWMCWRGVDNNTYFCTFATNVDAFYSDRKLVAQKGLPESLASWIRQKDAIGHMLRDVVQLRISLGPNNASYWAADGNYSTWLNLPPGLKELISSFRHPSGAWKTSMPRHVSLGVQGSYVVVTAEGGAAWAVSGSYPDLDNMLDGLRGRFEIIRSVTVDSHDRNNFMMRLAPDEAIWFVPDSMDSDMKEVSRTLVKPPQHLSPPTRPVLPIPMQPHARTPSQQAPPYRDQQSLAARQQQASKNMRVVGKVAGTGAAILGGLALGVVKGLIQQQLNMDIGDALGNIVGIAGGSLGGDSGGGGGGGGDSGGGGGGGVDSMAFQAQMQEDVWNGPVSDAAMDPIQ
ncbi:hypothetical protein CALCODRAFT_508268 [Calocera cornea HHB12733]|uniref:Uncharacterized protein n=1 Tax=Calocera cornea HHB12733 TaxID=1353952 RepID=A0A165GM86_9BASI|nr:hypothetical protein CALCODRAFT_508268 [Calocera cornea HHB12733]